MTAPVAKHVADFSPREGPGVSYDESIFNRVYGTAFYQRRRDWWLARFENLKQHKPPPITLFQKWFYPHRLQELDDELTAVVWSIGVKSSPEYVERNGYWPWRTDSATTLFKILGLKTSDFRIPPWWEFMYEEMER
jgi:hypothetical protein